MKNRQSMILVLITCMFVSATLGFLLGRSTAPGDVLISTVPEQTNPPQEQVQIISHTPPPTQSPVPSEAPVQPEDSGLVNINTATLAQLDALPGIGPVLAQRIIDYRETVGPFQSVSQLTQVEGIGEKRLADLIDLVTTE